MTFKSALNRALRVARAMADRGVGSVNPNVITRLEILVERWDEVESALVVAADAYEDFDDLSNYTVDDLNASFARADVLRELAGWTKAQIDADSSIRSEMLAECAELGGTTGA